MIEKIKFAGRFMHYFLKAKHRNGHGIHSPFIYDFVRKVLFKEDSKSNYSFIEKYRTELKKSSQVVDFEDFGAGSKVLKKTKRKIADIASFSSTRNKYGRLLARIIDYYQPKLVLEFGSSIGIGSMYLARFLDSDAELITIEGDSEIAAIAKKILSTQSNRNIQVVNAKFEQALPKLKDEQENFDFVFFDGNHTKEATINYFEKCVSKITNSSIFVFDDIHWSIEMEAAWEYIQTHTRTKVCIDLFQFGIVFFRKELTTQNYIIQF